MLETTMIPGKFDLAKWQIQIREMHSIFRALDKYVSDPDAMRAYFEKEAADLKRNFTKAPSGLGALASILKRVKEKYIRDAAEVYRRQMIVVAATLVEVMLRDFLAMLFAKHPMRMHQFLGDQGTPGTVGKVSLHEVVDAPTRESLLLELASNSAARISAKPFPRMFKAFLKVAGAAPKRVSESVLQGVIEQRNRIVHEASAEQISAERMKEVFRCLFDFAEDIGEIAEANGLVLQRPDKLEQALLSVSKEL